MGKNMKMNLKMCLFGLLLVLLTGCFLRPETVSAGGGIVLSVEAEVTAPEAGAVPQTELPQSGGRYRFTEIKWYVMNGTKLQEFTGTFQEGKRYVVTLTVKPNVGTLLATGSDLTATINGQKARLSNDFDAAEGGAISYIFPAVKSTLASGDGWYLDTEGCLHLIGEVRMNRDNYNPTRNPWDDYRSSIKEVVAEEGASCSRGDHLFAGCSNMIKADLRKLDITGVNSIYSMFSECSKLETVNLSGVNAADVVNMGHLFWGCTSLKSIDLSGFVTAKIERLNYAFYHCSSLSSIDLSCLKTANVTTMDSMFNGCTKLTELNLDGFSTAKVIYMTSMFDHCDSLVSIDLSGFCADSLRYYGGLFGENFSEIKLNAEFIQKVSDELYRIADLWADKVTGTIYKQSDIAGITGTVTLVKVPHEAHTYTGVGVTSTTMHICDICGKAGYHDFLEEVNTEIPGQLISKATCTSPAIYRKYCRDCHGLCNEIFEVGTALGHSFKGGAAQTKCDRCDFVREATKDVENLTVISGVNEATLSWSAVPGAAKYAVYMKTSAGTTTLLNGNVTTTGYKAEGLTGGEKVGFTVRPYTDSWGNYSPVVWAMVHTPQTAVVSKVVVTTDMNQATVSWSAVEGAEAYALYQKNSDGTTVLISNKITETTYTVTGLADGARVGYCVRARFGTTWYGYSTVTWVTLPAPAVPPTGIKTQIGKSSVTVTWNEVPGAGRYALYMKSASGALTLISAEVTGTSYEVTGLKDGETVGFVLKSRTSKGWSTWNATGWARTLIKK